MTKSGPPSLVFQDSERFDRDSQLMRNDVSSDPNEVQSLSTRDEALLTATLARANALLSQTSRSNSTCHLNTSSHSPQLTHQRLANIIQEALDILEDDFEEDDMF